METADPPCTEMDSIGSGGGEGGGINAEMGAVFDSYRVQSDRRRRYHLIRARRWGFLYYLLLSVSTFCSIGAGVILASFQQRGQSGIGIGIGIGIAFKWLGIAMTLTASVCSLLLVALHPSTQQQRSRDRAGAAIQLSLTTLDGLLDRTWLWVDALMERDLSRMSSIKTHMDSMEKNSETSGKGV